MNNEELKIASKLLDDFGNSIDNRSIVFLTIWEDVFPKILEWHFDVWQKEYALLIKKEKQLDKWSTYSDISRRLDEIIERIENRSLKERESSMFFNYFKKHAEKYKKEMVKGESNKYYYFESLFAVFYREFFKTITDSPENFDIWEHNFPEEWKITVGSLKNEENIISRASLNEFLRWAQNRIWQEDKKEIDYDLDNITSNLFPDASPHLWASILIFIFSTYGENRVKSVIERPWNFGHFGRMRIFSGFPEESKEDSNRRIDEEISSAEDNERKNTFELAYLLFSHEFSEEKLYKYINELKELKYKQDDIKENRRLRLLNMFEEMIKFKYT